MKSLVLLLLSFLIVSCNLENKRLEHKKEYSFNDLTVNFIRGTRATTFIKDGKPISGIVVQDLRRGRKNIWEVENGLATKQTMYYPDGQTEQILEMKNGVAHGTFIMYYSNGEKFVEQFYKNGEPVGIWHRWDRKGELIETTRY